MTTPPGTGDNLSAARFREAREYLGFSRDDVDTALGWPAGFTAAYEDGAMEPRAATLAKLGKLYRRPVGWFTREWEYHPGPDMVRRLNENPRLTDRDREAVLDFAEFLAGAGPAPKPRRNRG
jgi:hypothetical protein